MRKLTNISVMFLVLYVSSARYSWPLESNELLANFVYNLADYVQWHNKDKITICAYGADEISAYLDKIDVVHDRLSNIQNLNIITNIEFEKINSCNILYVAQNKEKDLLRVTAQTLGLPILTVSSIPNFIRYDGAVMEFKLSRGKVKLKLNDGSLKKTGLQISPSVLMAVSPNQDRG